MSLADSLNDLATAHNNGLVSDDEYRILRTSLFEEYTSNNPHHHHHRRLHQLQQQQLQQPTPPPPPLRRKQSVVSNVANLFRRATGRATKKHQSEPTTNPTTTTTATAALDPRRILRKPSIPTLLRPDPPPQSPHSDQDDPHSIRSAIAATEAEHERLLNAFSSLESSTLKRIQYKTARRLYTPTPASVNVLLEGREWRKHTKPVPSIVLPPPAHRHHSQLLSLSTTSSTTGTASDHLSIRSAASSNTSLSLSSLPRNHNPQLQSQSPLSPRFRHPNSLQRQTSLSSASTHSTGASSRFALGPRSTGNLQLSRVAERSSTDTIADSRINDDIDDDDPEANDHEAALRELHDVRRRRDELDARYLSRLEYLKAKLKAAELRDRVMRR